MSTTETTWNRERPWGTRNWPWGRITKVHQIGDHIDIVEYEKEDDAGRLTDETLFSAYIDGRNTGHSFHTIEESIVHTLAVQYDVSADSDQTMNLNTKADRYFLRAIRFPGV